jgi:hypothetical protein
MSGAEGPTKWQDQRSKKMAWQKDEKEGCNLGDKKLMNNSSYETSRTRKTSRKSEGPS